MPLKIRNRWNYTGNDRWDWEAFLDDAGSGELDSVQSVEYVLHPTFPNPLRRVASRNNQFAMKTDGWGVFELKAFVNMKDGSRKKLIHEVQLEYEPSNGISK